MSGEVRLLFDEYELVPATGELFRGGERVALQRQPGELLAFLAERAGEAVSRQEIRDRIWGPDTFVDHDQSINYCVRQIRHALGDDPAAPRYVETVPRHGYRFVAPVEAREIEPARHPAEESSEAAPSSPPPSEPARPRRGGLARRVALGALALAIAGFALWLATAGEGLGEPDGGAPSEDPRAAADATPRAPHQLVVPEDAHFRFLRARYLLERAEPAEHVDAATEAIELLESVVAEVPRHAEAHAVLADAWMLRFDVPRQQAMERAAAAARRALEIDPDLSLAHTVLAASELFLGLDWESAEEHLERALELEPNAPDAVFLSAIVHATRGRHERAIGAARRAAELDPAQLPGISLAWFYYFAGRFDEAVVEAERVLDLQPIDEPSHKVLVLAHLARGDEAAADAEVYRYFRIRRGIPEDSPVQYLGARGLYRTWWENRHLPAPGTISPVALATQAVIAGEPAAAIDLLLEACRERWAAWDLPFVAVDPRWDPLRDRERFQEVLDCVGVPEDGGVLIEGLDG